MAQYGCHPPAIPVAFLAGREDGQGVNKTCPLSQLPFNGGFPASSPSSFLLLLIGQSFVTYSPLNGKVAEKLGRGVFTILGLPCTFEFW